MTDRDVWDRMLDIMRETFDDDTIEVTRDSTAEDVDGWDSLSHIELIVALEAAFGVQFRTGEIAGLRTVGDLADVVTNRVRHANR
jgi:acyl carrier protein